MSRVALVTGAARGQGAAIVARLRADGFAVAAADLLERPDTGVLTNAAIAERAAL